jgi:hypothetical protein
MVRRPTYVVRIQESMTKTAWRAEVMRPSENAVSSAMPASEMVLVFEETGDGWTTHA